MPLTSCFLIAALWCVTAPMESLFTSPPPRVPEPRALSDSSAAPLFQTNTVLKVTISAPLETIFRDRSQDSEEHPGIVSYEDTDGSVVTLPVDIRTRGNSRLQPAICRFPPLRLDFPRTRVAGTLFAGQNKLKLVTHCQENRDYEQALLQEYLVYRTYNELSDLSFRVRLAHITYIDTDGDSDPITRYGFLIEPEDAMAARNGWEVLVLPQIHPDAMDRTSLNVLEVFQFLVGNIDWDPFLSEPGDDECCHNTKPIGVSIGPAFSIPFDFDITGVVRARYGNRLLRENLERYGLRNVRQRLYRGRCNSNEYLDTTIQLFQDRKAAIYHLYQTQEGLDPSSSERALEYYEDFYELIDNSGRVRRYMSGACRRI